MRTRDFAFVSYVTEEAGRKYVRDMPWPPAAECNMITNKQTKLLLQGLTVFFSFSRRDGYGSGCCLGVSRLKAPLIFSWVLHTLCFFRNIVSH